MLKKRTPILVGLLMLLGIAAFVMTFGALNRGMNLKGAYEVSAVFDNAMGLVKGSRVMMSGIPVGQIDTIKLDEKNPNKARVTIRLEKSITLREGVLNPKTGVWVNGATASRLQQSLLGDYYISVTPGVAGPDIENGGEIRNTVTEAGVNRVLAQVEKSSEVMLPKLEKITGDVLEITSSLREVIGGPGGRASLTKIRKNIEETSREVDQMSKQLHGFFNNQIFTRGDAFHNIVDNAEATSANVREISAQMRGRTGRIMTNLDAIAADMSAFMHEQTASGAAERKGTLRHTLAQIDRSADALKSTLDSARDVVGKVDLGEGTLGKLVNDSALYDNATHVARDIRSFTAPLARLQVQVEFHSEYLIREASLKNYVTFKLMPTPDKFYLFEIVSDPRGSTAVTRTVTSSNDPTKPPLLVESTSSTTNKLKFSVEFGKRWHFLTFRYGIIESTGGLGIDLDLLEDALRMKLDIFDFGHRKWPRLRLLAAYSFAEHIYVAVGVDDMLNADVRDYFVGAGITFIDSDLKTILPFVPRLP